MKKKILATLTVLALSMTTLAGCSGNAETPEPNITDETPKTENSAAEVPEEETTGLTTEDITLTVWESTGGPDDFIKQAGEAFTEKYPNIKIEFVNVELGDASTQIGLDGPGGVGPDAFAAPHDKLGELVAGGHILPTENPAQITANVLGACSSALTYEGKMYGYPISAETYALFYNKDLIPEADVPATWGDLSAFATDFNDKNSGKYGFMMDVGNGYYTILFTTSDGNLLFGPTGTDTSSTNINSAASVKGMEFFANLRSALNIPAADLSTSSCDSAFGSGNVALHITGPWNIATFEEQGVNFGVAPLPSLPGNDTPSASFSGTRAMFVSAYSEYPAEANAFAEFLVSEEMQQLRYEITGALPSIDVSVDSPYAAGFVTQLDYAFPMPSIPQMSAFWDAMNAASANIWDGADIQTELDACDAAILQ